MVATKSQPRINITNGEGAAPKASKMSLIRERLQAMGGEAASPKEVATAMRKEGIRNIAPGYVSVVKSTLYGKPRTQKTEALGKEDLTVLKRFVDKLGADVVKELVDIL